MALLNQSEEYIKLNTNGSYDIYASLEDRENIKNATPFEIIKTKYQEIIDSYLADEERQYYDSTAWQQEFWSWDEEYKRYLYDIQLAKGATSYPLMAQHYPDIANSVPNIIQSGSIVVETETGAEIYEIAKERKYWGETEDI